MDRSRPAEDARGKLKDLYDKAAAAGNGTVGPMVQAGSLNPDALEGRTLMYRALMFGRVSSLSRAEREMLAVATSVANRCHYWIEAHGEILRALTKDEALVEAILDDYREAALSARQRAMLDFAVKLTLEPHATAEEDVARLRAAGFDDADVSDIAGICADFNMVNRIASALGMEGKSGLAAV